MMMGEGEVMGCGGRVRWQGCGGGCGEMYQTFPLFRGSVWKADVLATMTQFSDFKSSST